jgi:hypothetical protein
MPLTRVGRSVPDQAIIESDQRVISRSPLFFNFRHPTLPGTGKQQLVRELPNKSGDVPKSPFPTVAVLVPSAGTITFQIELHSDACAISTRPPDVRGLLVARQEV